MGAWSSKPEDLLEDAIKIGDAQRLQSLLDRWKNANRVQDRTATQSSKAWQGFDFNTILPSGCTALQLAARSGNSMAIGQLLTLPAAERASFRPVDANAFDRDMRNALHHAARHKNALCVARLLAWGTDPCFASIDDKTPLDIAREQNCMACVRTLEDKVKLWQGWVDHYERGYLGKWTAKWLVVLQDRRPNSGSARGHAEVTCSMCSSREAVPEYVSVFPCSRCGTILSVIASSQIAIYTPTELSKQLLILPDTARPTIVQALPKSVDRISARSIEDGGVVGFVRAIFGGVRRVLQNTSTSQRTKGITLEVLDSRRGQVCEHSFRVATEEDQQSLIRILSDPARAAYDASIPKVEEGRGENSASPHSARCGAIRTRIASEPGKRAADDTGNPCASSSSSGNDEAGNPFASSSSYPNSFVPPPCLSKTSNYELRTSLPTGPGIPEPSLAGASICTNSTLTKSKTGGYALAPSRQSLPTNSTKTSAVPPATEEDVDDDKACVVCMERLSDTAVIPCGHLCGCGPCLQVIRDSETPQCPLCRGPLTSTIRIYTAG